jgi:intein/homing endonuclease
MEEVYVKDLVIDDVIMTETGRDLVISVEKLNYSENMYDLSINDINHRFYTNGILSHNSL